MDIVLCRGAEGQKPSERWSSRALVRHVEKEEEQKRREYIDEVHLFLPIGLLVALTTFIF